MFWKPLENKNACLYNKTMNIEIKNSNYTTQEKLQILADAAKYDVACTSSGSSCRGKKGELGNTEACGICHSFAADGRCISLLKILMTNHCAYDCKYCINRVSNDVKRATFTPEEICELTIEFYRRNYIEGLFLSSGILISPNYTMELIYQTLYQLRVRHHFNGYIHVKAIPGADPVLIEKVGFLADRMSINLELPTADGLKALAPNKSRKTILKPMRLIQNGIMENQNKQRDVERELKELVQKYNVLDKSQLYAYFEKDGRERFVGRALKVLEKDRMIYVNNETKQVAANESAHTAWERGISTCLWVLIDLMNQKKIEQHFLASKEEYPIRIIFVGDGEIYDILYIAPEDIELTNQLFVRKKIDGCGHVVVVEEPESIPKIRIPDVIGYCTVKGDGEVEYYQKESQ